jgi:1-acyl-sn-glycerol-3-phosphate acyltransferase
MVITGVFSLVIIFLSFGYLRNFCAKYILSYSSRLILRLMGFKGAFPKKEELPDYPVMYTFNHNSNLDIFLLTGLGLHNTRFILSQNTFKFVPLILSAKAIGTFYIPDSNKHEKRIIFFKRVTKFLQKRKMSIVASSEGVHEWSHGIAPFNKGLYHMAIEAKLPIVALYIHIPEVNNPMRGNKTAKGGTINIEYLKKFDTTNWNLDNLLDNIEVVRSEFVKRFEELNQEKSKKG